MLVRDAMSRDVVAVSMGTSIADALSVASEYGIEYLPVLDAGQVAGVLSASEFVHARLDFDAAGQMHVPAVCIDPGAPLEQAVAEMNAGDVSCLLAMDGDRLVGILTRGDLLRAGLSDEQVVGERRCSACGTYRHVHRGARDGLMLCVDCRERSIPPLAGEELGVAG
jgi:CBS-domain-containing membrane protein